MAEKDIGVKTEELEMSKGAVLTKVDSAFYSSDSADQLQKSVDEERIVEFFQRFSDESAALLLDKTGHGDDINHDNKDDLTFDIKYLLDKIIDLTDERTVSIFQHTFECKLPC